MEQLPVEVLKHVAGYLSPPDAIEFSRAGKALRSQLSLGVANFRRILTKFSKDKQNNDPVLGFRIPVPSQGTVAAHSVLLSMKWKDQGWGNRKSKVFVVATKIDQTPYESGRVEFDGGRVVYSSGIASHSIERLSITFAPRRGELYHLWYVVGGGGGHAIRLADVDVQALLFDRRSGLAHNFLVKSETLQPWDKPPSPALPDMLSTICYSAGHLLRGGGEIPQPMVSFFGRHGISEKDLSADLMDDIQTLWDMDRMAMYHVDEVESFGVMAMAPYEGFVYLGNDEYPESSDSGSE